MFFPPGKPLYAMCVLALVSGLIILARPTPKTAELRVWLFDESHAAAFRGPDANHHDPLSPIGRFENETRTRVAVNVLSTRAMDVRLLSTTAGANASADLVAIEIGSAGKYIREESPFLPIDPKLARGILAARLKTWSHKNQLLGLPMDVHPVSLTYRKDLFAEAGLDPSRAKTWKDFLAIARTYRAFWKSRNLDRRAIAMSYRNSDTLQILLLQRGVNLIDETDQPRLSDPLVADTLALYLGFVTGPDRVASDTASADRLAQNLAAGSIGALITPDWMIHSLRPYAAELNGKLAMIPLPVFDPTDVPTSTWGGTMLAIPKSSRRPERAMQLANQLLTDPRSLDYRARTIDVLPPIPGSWNQITYQTPDPLFDGQPINAMYARLAAQIPSRTLSPYTLLASASLSLALSKCHQLDETFSNDKLTEQQINERVIDALNHAQSDLAARINFMESGR